MKFDEERRLWEIDLRRMKESKETRTKELEISQANCEKLQRIISNLRDAEAKHIDSSQKIEFLRKLEKSEENERKLEEKMGKFEKSEEKAIKFIAEIEKWKQRNSKLELNLQEMRQIEANLSDYESKISSLLQENEMYKARNKAFENKVAKISEELERLTVISNRKLEENDALKQKCNRLEVLCTEMRVNEMKLRKLEENKG